jgi:acetate kinase
MAFDMYEYRIRKYIGAYIAAMGGIDALVFTAGIGENTPSLRTKLCQNLSYLGIELNEELNQKRGEPLDITTEDSKVRVFVIPTDEELVIARDTATIVGRK